jgi:hypothetical protein
MIRKKHFATTDITLLSLFCGLWTILNFILGRLSFALLGVPVLHDFAAFFTLLLVTWLTGKFGPASLVGILGSIIVVLVGGPIPNLGFAAAAGLFDVMMSLDRHQIRLKPYNVIVAIVATMASAYFAGAIIGVFLMGKPFDLAMLQWSLTFWGGWHFIGGVISVAITLPMIGILEKANVRKIRSD